MAKVTHPPRVRNPHSAPTPLPAVPVVVLAFVLALLVMAAARFTGTVAAARSPRAVAGHDALLECTLDAIRQVESSGGRNRRDGDSGQAIGEYQIHPAYWADATRILRVSWPYSYARHPRYARAAARAYVTYYQRQGRYRPCAETWARLHNGGPQGPSRTGTLVYWRKVQAAARTSRPVAPGD